MMDLRPYRGAGAKLADFLPWAALIAPGIVLNKDGAFQRTLAFRGADLESAIPAEFAGAAARLNNALRRFGSGWCLHMEARRAPAPCYPESFWPNGLAWLVDEERRQIFNAAGARFETRSFLTLTWTPPAERAQRLETLLFEGGEGDGANAVNYAAHLQRFIQESDAFLALLETLFPLARWLDDEETLTYLHDCISDRTHRVKRPATPFHLDALLPDAPLIGGIAPRLGAKHLKIISVRAFVSETEPGLLDALNRLPLSYRWVTRFLPLDQNEARHEIEKIRKRWFAKRKGLLTLLREALFREESVLQDNDSANQTLDADAALQALGSEGVGAGYATITITIAEEDVSQAEEGVRLVRQITDGLGFVTQVESVNAVEAWLGSLPGSPYADLRRPILLTASLAHLMPMSAVWAGPARNAHLKGPPLMLTATDGATPFRLDLHVGDVGHTLVIGPTGAGKSVLLGTLAAQFLRYDGAQVFLFDKGRSARATIIGLKGAWFEFGAGQEAPENSQENGQQNSQENSQENGLGLAPLARVDEPHARAWALDWLCDLMAGARVEINPARRAELWAALDLLAARPPRERTLSLFSALIQDEAARAALAPFVSGGAFGDWLDRDRNLVNEASVLGFEMEALLRSRAAIGAVLQALFAVLETRFDGRPTLLILDEAWAYLKDPIFAARIQDWLKTLRKKNVAVVFATQELADVEESPISSTLIEACATRILLPNDRAREPQTASFYQRLGLNARQIALIAEAIPKSDYYVMRRDGCRLFELGLGAAALAFFAAGRPEDQGAIDLVLRANGRDEFATAWLEQRGLADAAAALRRFDHARAPVRTISDPNRATQPEMA